jgi:ASC-1-like (ASCH) protein
MSHSELTECAINAMAFNNFIGGIREGVTLTARLRQYACEIDWSHGEATRAMANKFGDVAFLSGGFTYEKFIDYLFSRFEECSESSQDSSQLLSDDWKLLFSAALIPRGMELNSTFAAALRVRLHEAIFDKFVKEIRKNGLLRGNEDVLLERKDETMNDFHCTDTYWSKFIKGLRIDQKTKDRIRSSYELTLVTLHKTCQEIMDFAAEGHIYNRRLPLVLQRPTMLIDSQVESFSFREQSFIHALNFAAAFGSGILVFRLTNGKFADIVTVILGICNVLIAFATMTNISRYETHEEESGVVDVRELFSHLKKAVFSMMDSTAQNALSPAENPLLQSLEKCVRTFQRKARYHRVGETMEFNEAYEKLLANYLDVKKLASFRETIARELIADTFYINSHMQEALVDVYRTVDEIEFYLTHFKELEGYRLAAKEFLARLFVLEGRFEESLQQGQVWHRFLDSIICMFLYKVCCWSPSFGSKSSTMERDAAYLVDELRQFSIRFKQQVFRRELQNSMIIHRTTRQRAMASLIFVLACLIFMASLIFTIVRFCFVRGLDHVAFLCAATSSAGALLAILYLIQQFHHVSKLLLILRGKGRNVMMQQNDHFRTLTRVICFRSFLIACRFCAALAAVVVLALSIALNSGFGQPIPQTLPLWIAISSIITTFSATLLSCVDMYELQYQLAADLGPFICSLFRDEIRAIHKSMVMPPRNTVDVPQLQEREAWQYTARAFVLEWRFDTVLSVERLGQILQYIQSGAMDPGSEPPPNIMVMEP